MLSLLLLLLLPFTNAIHASVIDVPARPGELNRAVEAMLTAESEAPTSSTTTLRLAAGRHQVSMCARARARACVRVSHFSLSLSLISSYKKKPNRRGEQLLRPLDLHAAHSGLRFEGASSGASVISGGLEIPPASWAVFAPAKCPGCGSVMRAPLAAGTNYSRQLYLDLRPLILLAAAPFCTGIPHWFLNADRGSPCPEQVCGRRPRQLDDGSLPAARRQDHCYRLRRPPWFLLLTV